jgi:hypothetical protein
MYCLRKRKQFRGKSFADVMFGLAGTPEAHVVTLQAYVNTGRYNTLQTGQSKQARNLGKEGRKKTRVAFAARAAYHHITQ